MICLDKTCLIDLDVFLSIFFWSNNVFLSISLSFYCLLIIPFSCFLPLEFLLMTNKNPMVPTSRIIFSAFVGYRIQHDSTFFIK